MDDEIVVTVKEGETPPVTEPVVIVVETPPIVEPVAGDAAVVVFSLEQLAERVAELEREKDDSMARFESANSRLDNHSDRISSLEVAGIVEEVDDAIPNGPIVVESIPVESAAVIEEVKPTPRKRRFI